MSELKVRKANDLDYALRKLLEEDNEVVSVFKNEKEECYDILYRTNYKVKYDKLFVAHEDLQSLNLKRFKTESALLKHFLGDVVSWGVNEDNELIVRMKDNELPTVVCKV